MQGGESPIVDGEDTVLWRNVSPARQRKARSFFLKMVGSPWFNVCINFAMIGVFGLWLWVEYQDQSIDWQLIAICFAAAIIGSILGKALNIPFLYKTPRAAVIPSSLSPETLTLADPASEGVVVDSIKAISRTYHEGSPAILLALPKRSLTLITSDRDALLRALLTLRPDLEPLT